ncbi:phosphotransferase [Paenibacillus sp. FSL R7-0652]|uniref:aminoglycoside phosphotransferase family protein n=1 Tax=Paenibacillus sp. FSL R7-0652 TaxID=2921687 RepID=UPI003159DA2D
MLNDQKLQIWIQRTVKKWIDPAAEVVRIEAAPIHTGTQAIELMRHRVLINKCGETSAVSLVTKYASKIEQQVLIWLYAQKANVPFCLSPGFDGSEVDGRSLICIQDVDYETDYNSINISLLQENEMKALAHIHISNHDQKSQLSWLPDADIFHIEKMICERWRPQWEEAKKNAEFIEVFGGYIPAVEAAAGTILQDIPSVIHDERSQTLIHNDLNPGNVLVHNNTEVIFIDWEEAKYGSLFLDIPLRCRTPEQLKKYRELLAAKGIIFSDEYFNKMYTIASRYLGLRYMSWNLGAWTIHDHARDDLQRYMDMVVG